MWREKSLFFTRCPEKHLEYSDCEGRTRLEQQQAPECNCSNASFSLSPVYAFCRSCSHPFLSFLSLSLSLLHSLSWPSLARMHAVKGATRAKLRRSEPQYSFLLFSASSYASCKNTFSLSLPLFLSFSPSFSTLATLRNHLATLLSLPKLPAAGLVYVIFQLLSLLPLSWSLCHFTLVLLKRPSKSQVDNRILLILILLTGRVNEVAQFVQYL